MPDIFTKPQSQKARLRVIQKQAEAAGLLDPKPRFNFGRFFGRVILEAAVHIPVFVAIGISCYGYEQYGAFAVGLMPLTLALSYLLSRTYSMFITTHRLDVAAGLLVIGIGGFLMEAYGVHLGAVRFNEQNAAQGLQTFSEEALITASIVLGIMNVWSRRAYITGHEDPAELAGRPEPWWKWQNRRAKFTNTIARNTEAPRIRNMPADYAHECYRRNGAWPLGYAPTAEDLAAVA